VRRHLENIYVKLGVHTRTAAATRLLGVLDDEERQRRSRIEHDGQPNLGSLTSLAERFSVDSS
jgi:hypothetical protein